jgi:hypothetical protein
MGVTIIAVAMRNSRRFIAFPEPGIVAAQTSTLDCDCRCRSWVRMRHIRRERPTSELTSEAHIHPEAAALDYSTGSGGTAHESEAAERSRLQV